jgi:hypothetical protein
MVYALWDTDVGNRIDWYETEDAALADVRLALARYGREVVRAWALMRHEGEAVEAIADGEELIERARAAEAPA